MTYIPTAKSYFTGAGGMDIGFMQAGIEVKQSLDLDPKATAILKANSHYFSHSILTEDIVGKTVLDQIRTDIIIGTYPCTKYSTIGDIHGVRTGDDLYLHFLRHLVLERPEMYVLENVPGMMKFPVVMEVMTKLPDYYVHIFCPVKASLWLPQERDRVIIIGTRKPFTPNPPDGKSKRVCIKDIIENDPEYRLPNYVISRIEGKYRDLPIIVDPNDRNAIAPTCVAHYHKDLGTRMVKTRQNKYGLRPFTILEYARLQGFPDDYRFPDKQSSYMYIGNAVPIPMGKWAGEQAMSYFNRRTA